jgi:hypothetical protein
MREQEGGQQGQQCQEGQQGQQGQQGQHGQQGQQGQQGYLEQFAISSVCLRGEGEVEGRGGEEGDLRCECVLAWC